MPIGIDENLEYKVIETIQDTFVANTKIYGNLKKKKMGIKEISKLPFVLQSEVSSSRKYLNSICKKDKIKLNNGYELESYDLVLTFVKAGLGIGFVNRSHIVKELKNGELFELNLDYKIPTREIGIAFNKKNGNNKYIQNFIKAIDKNIDIAKRE